MTIIYIFSTCSLTYYDDFSWSHWHGAAAFSTAASQQADDALIPRPVPSLLTCPPCFCTGSLMVHQFPPTIQIDSSF